MAVKNMLKRPSRASSKRSPGVKKYKKNFGKKSDKIVNKPKQKPTTLVGQDVQFARSLASNDKKKREKTLKKLRVWISVRSKTDFGNFSLILFFYNFHQNNQFNYYFCSLI